MKILMLHNRYLQPGGEDQSAPAEAALLSRHGHEVELLEEDNRRVEELGRVRAAMRALWSRDAWRLVCSRLGAGGFDVLHVQNFFPLWSPAVYYAAARCGVPVVQTLRNYRLLCPNALFFRGGHPCQDCLGRLVPWPGVLHACYRESRAASSVVAAMAAVHKAARTWHAKVHAYVALTAFAREKFISGGFPAERISVKPNFLDPAPAPGPGGGGYAMFVGRLSPEKGVRTMIDAWNSAPSALPLKIAGDGPLREYVVDAARRSPHIAYLGWTTPEQTLQLIAQAELMVCPSESYEGMPRAIIEAFAVGTPVLASRLGAMASMVAPDRDGWLFLPGDSRDLRRHVEWCSQNLGHVRSLRGAARAQFEADYTGSRNLARLLEIYRKAQEQQRFSTGRRAGLP